MDQTPAPLEPTTPEPATQPFAQPTTPPSTPTVAPIATPVKSMLALWSMILGIVSIVLALVFFISIPAAIVAIILGIVALSKHRPGKGKSLTGIITGGVALFVVIPISFVIAISAINSLQEAGAKLRATPIAASSTANSVLTDCYSYTIPTNYVYEPNSKDCYTAVNISGGDDLTRILVKGTTGTIGTLSDVVAQSNTAIKKASPDSKGIIEQEQFIANGKTVYYIAYEDGYKLLYGRYIINDPNSTKTVSGESINAYSVIGYTYNAALKANVRSVVDSLITK